MKTMYFKCELLSDVVLNQRAATVGNQKSLDFIPGNNFLGIAAGQLYNDNELSLEDKSELFHSGKVRFGDAHPEKGGKRSLRIPASMYKSKSGEMSDGLYIHHEVEDPNETAYKKFQPKQCREGFYIFNEENLKIEKIEVKKTFSIKSAHDKKTRRSQDEKMYGYESLEIGSNWIFEVTLDDDAFEKFGIKIEKALTGTKRIGRSRTAQYGLVKIEVTNAYPESAKSETDGKFALVYADARLMFLDEFGLPTFQPNADDLGFTGGEIDWNKSQIRTFQYAPWNSKRQTKDADRCGIEKGSVFYVKTKAEASKLVIPENLFVGFYQNEGFGKIILNPKFLQSKNKSNNKSNGKAMYTVPKSKENRETQKTERKMIEIDSNDPLLIYLVDQNNKTIKEQNIYKQVNEFVESYKNSFKSETFASQWGSIRSIAMQHQTKGELKEALFALESGYLMHGVAKDKWTEGGRTRKLEEFFDKLDDESATQAIVNLAAEMAKIPGGKQ